MKVIVTDDGIELYRESAEPPGGSCREVAEWITQWAIDQLAEALRESKAGRPTTALCD